MPGQLFQERFDVGGVQQQVLDIGHHCGRLGESRVFHGGLRSVIVATFRD
ncbi:hypothetical protein [Paenarthrobacter histidinolovorans]|uniref:Uncharacterized protein n=1 Tax=Paenarthrobacter histidinolovorans TaxID=43664 RepID=A0ABW8NCR7_9MICC